MGLKVLLGFVLGIGMKAVRCCRQQRNHTLPSYPPYICWGRTEWCSTVADGTAVPDNIRWRQPWTQSYWGGTKIGVCRRHEIGLRRVVHWLEIRLFGNSQKNFVTSRSERPLCVEGKDIMQPLLKDAILKRGGEPKLSIFAKRAPCALRSTIWIWKRGYTPRLWDPASFFCSDDLLRVKVSCQDLWNFLGKAVSTLYLNGSGKFMLYHPCRLLHCARSDEHYEVSLNTTCGGTGPVGPMGTQPGSCIPDIRSQKVYAEKLQ